MPILRAVHLLLPSDTPVSFRVHDIWLHYPPPTVLHSDEAGIRFEVYCEYHYEPLREPSAVETSVAIVPREPHWPPNFPPAFLLKILGYSESHNKFKFQENSHYVLRTHFAQFGIEFFLQFSRTRNVFIKGRLQSCQFGFSFGNRHAHVVVLWHLYYKNSILWLGRPRRNLWRNVRTSWSKRPPPFRNGVN